MWNLLRAELLKLRRCQILLVGLMALGLCPLVQYGSQMIIEAEYRDPDYDIRTLFANVVWGNTQIFLPISLVMTGAWLMDRESSHDTLKNIMAVPVSMPGLLGTKLLLTGMLAVLLGIYSAGRYPGHWTGGRPAGTDCGGAFSWQYADRGGCLYYKSGLYAPDPDLWTDPRGISGRLHPGVLPGIQHAVLQRRRPFQPVSVFGCAGPGGLRSERICRDDRGSGSGVCRRRGRRYGPLDRAAAFAVP